MFISFICILFILRSDQIENIEEKNINIIRFWFLLELFLKLFIF